MPHWRLKLELRRQKGIFLDRANEEGGVDWTIRSLSLDGIVAYYDSLPEERPVRPSRILLRIDYLQEARERDWSQVRLCWTWLGMSLSFRAHLLVR